MREAGLSLDDIKDDLGQKMFQLRRYMRRSLLPKNRKIIGDLKNTSMNEYAKKPQKW